MFVYKKFKASDAGILAFEAHKEYNVDSDNSASLDISFVNTKYSSASLDTYSSGLGDILNAKRYRQVETLLYKGGVKNYGNLLGGLDYINQEKRLYGRANILDISQKNTGNGIQKGTFNLNGAYKDDSKGNLYDSTDVTLVNGYAQNYPKETERCFYLGPIRGYKYTDLNYEIRTGRLIVNAPFTYDDRVADDSIYLNSVEYVSSSIKYMGGNLSEYTGIDLVSGYVKVAHSNNFNFNDEDFTISFWYDPSSLSAAQTRYLISKAFTKTVAETPVYPELKASGGLTDRQEVDAGNSYPFAIYRKGGNFIFERSDENSTSRLSSTAGTGLAHHAFVKTGSELQHYRNGVQLATVTDTTSNCGNEADLFIGNKGGSRSIKDFGIISDGGVISQLSIYNKALNAASIAEVSKSINGSPFVGNIFYENGIATITKPNIAANTLVSAETVTETLTLGTIPNNVDPDYVFAIIANDVFTGELTFFTSSSILDIAPNSKADFDAISGLVLTDPTFTDNPANGGDFILSTSGSQLTTTVFVNPIFEEFEFILRDSDTELSSSFQPIIYGDDEIASVGEPLNIQGSLLTDIGYPASEGEYAFYHPPQTILSSSFVFEGAGLGTSRGYRSNNIFSSQTHLSSWFNDTMIDRGWGTGEYTSMLRRLARTGANQTSFQINLNAPTDQSGALQLVATNNTVAGGIPISNTENITNATTFRNLRLNSPSYMMFSVTGSRGNIASINGAKMTFTSSHDSNEHFVTASNSTYNTAFHFPGSYQNGGINTTLTSSTYTHLNSHPNIFSAVKSVDNTGMQFRSAQLLGGRHVNHKAIYSNLDEFRITATFTVAPSGSAGGQIFQYKLVYYNADNNSYWDIYDKNGNKCESSVNNMPENPSGGDFTVSTPFTIDPSNTSLTSFDDVNVSPSTFNAFEDEDDKIILLFKTELDPNANGTSNDILILENSGLSLSDQSPSFGPRDVLYLESDFVYPLTGSHNHSHIFSINGITTDSASLGPLGYINDDSPSRGILDNISSSFYVSQSDGVFAGTFDYNYVETPLALRVELVEFDIDPDSPSPNVPDFFQGGRILTSSLFPAGTNIGGDFNQNAPTVTADAGDNGLARDLDFQFEITKSLNEQCAIAWRMGVVSADNPGDLTSVDDFPLIPVNTAEGFGFSGIHIATYNPTATYSLAPSPDNPNPLTNDELRMIFNNTHSINHQFVGNPSIHKNGNISIGISDMLVEGITPTQFVDFEGSSLNPSSIDIHFNTEFLITESRWVISSSYQPALPVQISASFVTDQKGLYEIHGLKSLYFHNPQDPLDDIVPLFDNYVTNPDNAPQLQYKIFADGVEQTDFSQTSSFAPNNLQTLYNDNADIIGAMGYFDAGVSMSIEVTLVTGSDGDDALVYPHQGIALQQLEIIGLTSSFQVTKLNGDAFTLQEITAVSCSVQSPHTDVGEPLFPFNVGVQSAIHIVSFSGGSLGRQTMHLGLDYFVTESSNMMCELQYDNPFSPIEAKIPFNYESGKIYSFDLQQGSIAALESYTDDPIPSDAGFGFKIIDQSGTVLPNSTPKFINTNGATFCSPTDNFDAVFDHSGTGHVILFSSGAHAGDYLDGNVSASYTIEINRFAMEINELQGSDTSNEDVTYTGDVTPDTLKVTSSHSDQGSHGFFTTGSDSYDIVGFIGGNGGKVKINRTLFITASSDASASVDEASGFDYTQTPVVVNSGDLTQDMVGGTFEFTDITGTTVIYTITAVGSNTITLSSQTVPAAGFNNQILVAPEQTNITLTYNQPADNENFSLVFKNNQLIFENEFHCTVDEDEYNFTLNPTARKYKTIQRGELANFATGSNFRPYVTTVGLYNDEGELLVVGKLAQPVKMSNETDTTFVVRYDT